MDRQHPWRAWALGVSLLGNVTGAVWLLTPNPVSSQPAGTDRGAIPSVSGAPSPRMVVRERSAQDPAESPGPAPFHWSQIESDDYRDYIANLRAVGCPEQTIRDLITADLAALYTPRARAILDPPRQPYWKPSQHHGPTPNQLDRLQSLEREQLGVMRELLGGRFSLQDQIDLVFFQLQGDEEQLLFLPEDQRVAALDALGQSNLDQREQRLQQSGSRSTAAEDKLFDEKLALLARVLAPHELEEYRLRASPRAQALRVEFQYFDCTPEEFAMILDQRRKDGEASEAGNLLDRSAATAQVRKLLGEERAREFERVTDMHYQQARRSADAMGLPVEAADQAWAISRELRQAAQGVASDSKLSLENRATRIEALRMEADARLQTALGEHGSRLLRRDLKVVLRGAMAGAKP